MRPSFSGGLGFAQPPATQEDSCGIIGGGAGIGWHLRCHFYICDPTPWQAMGLQLFGRSRGRFCGSIEDETVAWVAVAATQEDSCGIIGGAGIGWHLRCHNFIIGNCSPMASHGATIVWPQSRPFLWLNGEWDGWMSRSRGRVCLWGLDEWGRISPIGLIGQMGIRRIRPWVAGG